MDLGPLGIIKTGDLLFLAIIVSVAAGSALATFAACFYWFRREQRRLHGRIFDAVVRSEPERFGESRRGMRTGELVAQFKDKQGRQVISVLEADGKRFLHIDGEISARERARMVRYLKSEGFMS
jgi:hypothetical protein